MLFNSYVFICAFLPILVLGYFLLARVAGKRTALGYLIAGSLFYYAWWEPSYVWLILFSSVFNYGVGVILGRAAPGRLRYTALVCGIATNLGLLAYYKYVGLLQETLETLFGFDLGLGAIVLPLAVSFFTFQQIAFLVDAYRGETREYDFLDYLLFVTFFPQLIAGPIVHHKEMLPQFEEQRRVRIDGSNLAIGLALFTFGLAKKVLVADSVAGAATQVFGMADGGQTPDAMTAWVGTLAYTVQIYFDFSGYSDMAIGLGRIFGIRLPLNFNSPYKAASIVDFWRRWHMTLSRFLRDYLYIPLGGSRRGGAARRYANLMVTMLLGGLWHGAGWTFVVWGGLHGCYLVINHMWSQRRPDAANSGALAVVAKRTLTLGAVALAWVFFRAETFSGAGAVLSGLVGLGTERISFSIWVLAAIGLGLVATWTLPNSQEFVGRFDPALGFRPCKDAWWQWRPSISWGIVLGLLFSTSLICISRYSEFIYFQF
ncbi:MAG: MBOAT family protein [Planctomycetota bacterium]